MLTATLLALAAVLLWPVAGPSVPPSGSTGGEGAPRAGAGEGRRRGGGGDGVERGTGALSARRLRCRRGAGAPSTRRRQRDDAWVADVAEVVAVGLDAGLDLPRAVAAAARSPSVRGSAPWLADRVREVLVAGGAVSACLDPRGRTPAATQGDLDLLAASWRLAEESGAPAAVVTAAAAEAVRERRASRQRTAVVVSGPRTSMWLLTALPVAGPLGAALVGFGPARLYATPGARVAAVAGLVLTGLGWLWARRLLSRAGRQATTGLAPLAEPGPPQAPVARRSGP